MERFIENLMGYTLIHLSFVLSACAMGYLDTLSKK